MKSPCHDHEELIEVEATNLWECPICHRWYFIDEAHDKLMEVI